jgi:GNAT superfamily N-acetyltransferase
MADIRELEVSDDAALREFFDVEQAAHRADRPHVVLRTFEELRQMARRPSPYYRRTLLVARDGGRIVGVADLGRTVEDNLHLADLAISVLPRARRRGIGRALHDEAVRLARADGRTTILGEVIVAHEGATSPGLGFASALGFEVVHREDHQVLELPPPSQHPAATADAVPGYEIVTWGNRVPGAPVEDYAAMLTQMGPDVPTGGIAHQPNVIDVDRIRAGEERLVESCDQVVAAARRTADGVLGGYTLIELPHGQDHVVQNDTLVMPDHRGHGLGIALKSAVLALLAAEHPERTTVHTWNAVDNAPMQRINRELGFRPVELELEVQRRDG